MGETVGDLEEDRIAIRSNFCSITYQKNTVMIMPKILIVATGIGAYANAILPTGLWLSELTHIYHRAKDVYKRQVRFTGCIRYRYLAQQR